MRDGGANQPLEACHRLDDRRSQVVGSEVHVQMPDIASFDLASLRRNTVTSFGITSTGPLAAQWRSHAPNCTSFEAAYGLSETPTCDT